MKSWHWYVIGLGILTAITYTFDIEPSFVFVLNAAIVGGIGLGFYHIGKRIQRKNPKNTPKPEPQTQ